MLQCNKSRSWPCSGLRDVQPQRYIRTPTHEPLCRHAQIYSFDLSAAAPDPTIYDLSFAVAGVTFHAQTVRVVASSAASTTLLVGGLDTTNGAAYPGVVIYGTVAAGAAAFAVSGSVALPSFGDGVTVLSQTSPLLPGLVLAATDEGVFKCVPRPRGASQMSLSRPQLWSGCALSALST